MRRIFKLLTITYIVSINSMKSQTCVTWPIPNCGCLNSQYAGNYCCGHDPEFVNQTPDHMLLWPQDGAAGNNCDDSNFDFATVNSVSSIPGGYPTGWFLIWNDEFNYSVLDESFYSDGYPWGVLFDGDQNTTQAVCSKNNIFIENGKLKLKAFYDNNPDTLFPYWNNNGPQMGHWDYSMAAINTKIHLPVNSRIQTSNKLYPNSFKTWPALWLFGDQPEDNKYQEIDIYEITNGLGSGPGSNSPQTSLKMTYHATQYGSVGDRKQEGIHHETLIDMTNSWNQYDLIWDKWKIQWWFNSNIVHEINKYYHIPSSWNDQDENKKYRKYPMSNYEEMSLLVGERFSINKYFPESYPSRLIFSFGLKSDITPSDVGSDKAQEMEFLKIWLRKSCSINTVVSSTNYVRNNGTTATVIEMGNNISTVSGSPVTISGSSPNVTAIYAGLNEIAFNDGFSVDPGANFFAFLSTCEQAWEQKIMNVNQTEIAEEEHEATRDVIDKQTINSANSINRHDITFSENEDQFNFSCANGDIYSLTITDMKGQLVYQSDSHSKEKSVNKLNFTPGIYVAVTKSAAGIDVRKIWVIK